MIECLKQFEVAEAILEAPRLPFLCGESYIISIELSWTVSDNFDPCNHQRNSGLINASRAVPNGVPVLSVTVRATDKEPGNKCPYLFFHGHWSAVSVVLVDHKNYEYAEGRIDKIECGRQQVRFSSVCCPPGAVLDGSNPLGNPVGNVQEAYFNKLSMPMPPSQASSIHRTTPIR